MQFVIDYAKIDPDTLNCGIEAISLNLMAGCFDLDEDKFLVEVMAWLPPSDQEIEAVKAYLAPYLFE